MNKKSSTLILLVLASVTLAACPANKCGNCNTDDTKSFQSCTQCYKSKIETAVGGTTCTGSETGIVGCAASYFKDAKVTCLMCDNRAGYFKKDAAMTDCSIKCVNDTQYFDETSFTCKERVLSKDNCGKPSHMSDECEECKMGYSVVAKKCESLSAIANCHMLDMTDKAKCSVCHLGYWLKSATVCEAMTVTNKDKCVAGSSATACTQCVEGWWLKNDNICYDLAVTGLKTNCGAADKADTPVCKSCIKGYKLKADLTCVDMKGCGFTEFNADTGFCKLCKHPDFFATAADTTPAKVGIDYHQVCTKSTLDNGDGSSNAKIVGSILSIMATMLLVL